MHLTVFLSQLNRRSPLATGGFFVLRDVCGGYLQPYHLIPGEIGAHAIHPPGKRSIDINKSHFHTDTCGRTRRSAPTRRICFHERHQWSRKQIQHFIQSTNKRPNATAGGLGSGCAGSRTFQPTGGASQESFGVCQGGHRPRWSKPADRQKTTHRDHRGWSTHKKASRNKPAKPKPVPNRIFVTSGEIGAHAMHPPGKRVSTLPRHHSQKPIKKSYSPVAGD